MRGALALALLCVACSNGTEDLVPDPTESCDTYCSFLVLYCQNGNLLFDNLTDCDAGCAAYATTGTAGDTQGNTLQCRLTYLFAAPSEPVAFCLEASPQSPSCQ